MSDERCVMAVHAHPDDEATKGAATIAWLAARGVRTVLVTCTDGSAGEPPAEVGSDDGGLVGIRRRELAESAAILGFATVHVLGHVDSGVDGSVKGAYVGLPLPSLVTELSDLMRREQPDVVVSYDPAYAAGHPDHARCAEVTELAFAAARVDTAIGKLYGTRTHSFRRLRAMHAWLVEHGLSSPYGAAVAEAVVPDRLTTRVEVGRHVLTARQALRAHRSQVAVDEPWFFAVPDEAIVDVYPWEDFQLLATKSDRVDPESPESDLLAGLA